MAELVDAQVSGTCGSDVVEVRVFFWAPSLTSLMFMRSVLRDSLPCGVLPRRRFRDPA